MSDLAYKKVLVLNADGRPHQIQPLKEMIHNVVEGNCMVLELASGPDGEPIPLRSSRIQTYVPSVVQLYRQVVRKQGRGQKFNRHLVYERDGYTCQYCGDSIITNRGMQVTLDHVHPRHHGGQSEYTNVVTCCDKCNAQKRNKMLTEMRDQRTWNGKPFKLQSKPVAPDPKWNPGRFVRSISRKNLEWLKYVPNWRIWARRYEKDWLLEEVQDEMQIFGPMPQEPQAIAS